MYLKGDGNKNKKPIPENEGNVVLWEFKQYGV